MKTLFSLLLCLAFTTSLLAYPGPLPGSDATPLLVKVSSDAPHALMVRLANLQKAPTALILKDKDGQAYFQKNIKQHNGYLLRVDMENAPQGRYFLHARQGDEEVVVVLYRHQDVTLVSDSSRI